MKAVLVFGHGILLIAGSGLFAAGIDYGDGLIWGIGMVCLFIAGGFAAEIYQRML